MSLRTAALLVLVGLLAPRVGWAAPSISPQTALQQSRIAYQRHEYKEAEDSIKMLVDQMPTEEDTVAAHRILALAYFFQKKLPEAKQEVITILSLRPDYKLDPAIEQPVAVSFFEEVRKQQEDRLREIKRRQEEESERLRRIDERRRAEERARWQRIYLERTVEKHSRVIAALPFGIGQWQNGHRKLAALFASSELALGATSLGLWITVTVKYPGGVVGPTAADKNFANLLSNLQIGFGIAFWATIVAGIIDAQARFVPEVVRERELAGKKPSKTTFQLVPNLSPGHIGLGLQGVF